MDPLGGRGHSVGNIQRTTAEDYSPPLPYPYPAETTPLLQSQSREVSSPVGTEGRRGLPAGDQGEGGLSDIESSDQHKNKDFQLIHVPSGKVSLCVCGGSRGVKMSLGKFPVSHPPPSYNLIPQHHLLKAQY